MAEQDSCGIQAGLITELLDVIAKHLEDKPFEPHAFNRTIRWATPDAGCHLSGCRCYCRVKSWAQLPHKCCLFVTCPEQVQCCDCCRECMEQGGLPSSLILAPFQELVHDAAAASPKTVTLLDWLLEEACPAEGVPQLGDVEAWTTAEALYRLGFLAEREWPRALLPKHCSQRLSQPYHP